MLYYIKPLFAHDFGDKDHVIVLYFQLGTTPRKTWNDGIGRVIGKYQTYYTDEWCRVVNRVEVGEILMLKDHVWRQIR